MKDRIAQVNELLKEELGQIILREIDIPEKAIVTLTRVDCTPNLQQAKVYISVMPDEKAREALTALQRNIYDIQQVLNERLQMRPVPRIQWVLDTAAKEAQRIEQLLNEIKEKEK